MVLKKVATPSLPYKMLHNLYQLLKAITYGIVSFLSYQKLSIPFSKCCKIIALSFCYHSNKHNILSL